MSDFGTQQPSEPGEYREGDPIAAMVSWKWICDVLKPIGFSVVCVECISAMRRDEPEWPLFGPIFDDLLRRHGLGELDSQTQPGPITRWFFIVPAREIVKALWFILREAKKRGLADRIAIGHADPEDRKWRDFHPGLGREFNL